MRLRPCEQCRRHVTVSESRCPFCGDVLALDGPGLVVPLGRLSRAAVFAGATLAGACWTSSSAPRETPIEHELVETKPSPPTPGTIRGVVRNGANGQPLPGFTIILQLDSGEIRYATSDQQGVYTFVNVAPGTYALSYQTNTRQGLAVSGQVTLGADAGAQQDVSVTFPEPDRGPCCKPYGAPPARRRIV